MTIPSIQPALCGSSCNGTLLSAGPGMERCDRCGRQVYRAAALCTPADDLGREIVQTLQAAEEIMRDFLAQPSRENYRRLWNLRIQVERVNKRAGMSR